MRKLSLAAAGNPPCKRDLFFNKFYSTNAHHPLEMQAVQGARAFTMGSAIKPTTALAKKILQKDFWRRGGAAEIITTSAPRAVVCKIWRTPTK